VYKSVEDQNRVLVQAVPDRTMALQASEARYRSPGKRASDAVMYR
jgi:hypothetical protein